MESAQSLTKSLREKATSIDERTALAERIYKGQVDVFLPDVGIVLLEWIFSVLATERDARVNRHVWNLLGSLWAETTQDVRNRIFPAKFAQTLLAALKENGPFQEIMNACVDIGNSAVIRLSSDAQGGELVQAYLSSLQDTTDPVGNEQEFSQLIYAIVKSRQGLFKTQPEALPLLLGYHKPADIAAFYLTSYFSTATDTFITYVIEQNVASVLKAVLMSGVEVEHRFKLLVKTFPKRTGELLECLEGYTLSKDLLSELIQTQIKDPDAVRDGHALRSLILLSPESVYSELETFLSVLVNGSSEITIDLANAVVEVFAKMRILPSLLKELDAKIRVDDLGVWGSEALEKTMLTALQVLSVRQLEQVLEECSGAGLAVIASSLSYPSTTKGTIENMLSGKLLTASWKIRLCIMNLYPKLLTSPGNFNDYESSFDCIGCCLRMMELEEEPDKPLQKQLSALVKKWKPLDGQVEILIARFSPVLSAFGEKVTLRLVSSLEELDGLFQGALVTSLPLFMRNTLFDRLIQVVEQGNHSALDAVAAVPDAAITKDYRRKLLNLAWKAGNLPILCKLLTLVPFTVEDYTSPSHLIHIVESAKLQDHSLLVELGSAFSSDRNYVESLYNLLDWEKWQHQCFAAGVSANNDAFKSRLVQALQANLENKKFMEPTLATAKLVKEVTDDAGFLDAVIRTLLTTPPDSPYCKNLFSIICGQNMHWSAVTAYFIYTGSQFTNTYAIYCSKLSPEQLRELFFVASREYYFGVLQVLISFVPKYQVYQSLTSLMVLGISAHLKDMSSEKLDEFFVFANEMLQHSTWLLSQFTLETILQIIVQASERRYRIKENTYVTMARVMSRILLSQRYRLIGRMHLILKAVCSLLALLSDNNSGSPGKTQPTQVEAESFFRVIQNLCEPPQQSVRAGGGKSNLTSSVARTRRTLSKHVGVLLANYIYFSLNVGFNIAVRETVKKGIYNVFGVLSTDDMTAFSSTLDAQGRAFLRPLYGDYKKFHKWTRD